MRALVTYVFAALAGAAAATLALVALQNDAPASLSFFGTSTQWAQGAIIGLAALLGFLVAALLLGPARATAAARARDLHGRVADLEGRLSALDLEHRRLEHAQERETERENRAAEHATGSAVPGESPHRTADIIPPGRDGAAA